MDERLITIIKEPHFAFFTFDKEDGSLGYTLVWCEYKLYSSCESEVGTQIRIRSARNEVDMVHCSFPDRFRLQPWLIPIDTDALRRLIEDEMARYGFDKARARNDVFNTLKKDIDNPLIMRDVRAALDYEPGNSLDVDVCHLPFSVRLINILRDADINTLGDLLRVNKISFVELNGLGKKCLDEIKNFYAANGYDFGSEFLEWDKDRGWPRRGKWYLPKKQQ